MPLIHYTDVNAVHSILSNQVLWLTDIRFLNDTVEMQQGITHLKSSLEWLKNNNKFTAQNHIKTIEIIESFLNSTISDLEESSIFVFSFSNAYDRLSQWRSYGYYGIEFDEAMLKEHKIFIEPCFYEEQDINLRATRFLLDSITKINEEIDSHEGCITELSIDEIASLTKLAATFKNQAFFEEEETRIIVSDIDTTKYRIKNDKLIPYVELACPLDCIKAIHVGPMIDQELAYLSMLNFVKQVEKDWQNFYGDIEFEIRVEKSSIPYRG